MQGEYRQTPRPVGRVNLLLILAAGGATLYACWSLYVTPVGGSRIGAVLPLVLASGVFFNRLVLSMQRRVLSMPSIFLRLVGHAGRWALTLILPLALAALVNVRTDAREQRQIAAHFAPLLDFIDRSMIERGQSPGDLSGYEGGDLAALPFTYLYADDRYMLLTDGGSIDIDGSTVYFSSASRTWSRIHDDLLKSATQHPDVLKYMRARKDLNALQYP